MDEAQRSSSRKQIHEHFASNRNVIVFFRYRVKTESVRMFHPYVRVGLFGSASMLVQVCSIQVLIGNRIDKKLVVRFQTLPNGISGSCFYFLHYKLSTLIDIATVYNSKRGDLNPSSFKNRLTGGHHFHGLPVIPLGVPIPELMVRSSHLWQLLVLLRDETRTVINPGFGQYLEDRSFKLGLYLADIRSN
jgi:hypothetical protein